MNAENKNKAKIFFEEIKQEERQRTCGEEAAQRYHTIHQHRFQATVHLCKQLVPNSQARVLDVGPSYLSKLLAQTYRNVSTLGIDIAEDHGGQQNTSTMSLTLPHITFDLKNAPEPHRWPNIDQLFDLIVYAETIEHLPIAPEYSLIFLRSLLADGGILLVTTPNAAMIMKRFILLLKGKNPYERIRLFAENPGHYHEYTMNELIALGKRCQLDVVQAEYINFYPSENLLYGMLKNIRHSFKDSMVIAFRRQ